MARIEVPREPTDARSSVTPPLVNLADEKVFLVSSRYLNRPNSHLLAKQFIEVCAIKLIIVYLGRLTSFPLVTNTSISKGLLL